jgi:4-hydroxyphenylpyruvate dioxygenase
MPKREPLGIKKIEALHYYVHDLERTRRFFVEQLDFVELGRSGPELDRDGRQRAAAFQAGQAMFVIHQPIGEGGRAWRYLRKHPEGVGTVVLEVEEIDRAFRLLDERGGTFITDVQRFQGDRGEGALAMFSITTPFGDTTFRFVERHAGSPLFPGFVPLARGAGAAAGNRFGFTHIDHLTANFQTMKPALLWMEHVLGFEPFWEIAFHTNDVAAAQQPGRNHSGTLGGFPNPPATDSARPADLRPRDQSGTLGGFPNPPATDSARQAELRPRGSGLKSVVMWDPYSGIKLANNEPFRPFFKESQINIFAEDNRGDGIQHSALAVKDIVGAVRGLRERGVGFMSTPDSYFDMLPERLRSTGIGAIDESVDTLRALGILIDGDKPRAYMLQIFLKEAAGLYQDPEAGPFFFEVIQRKGDQGFGAGNFRALFEAIEREQQQARAAGTTDGAPSPASASGSTPPRA